MDKADKISRITLKKVKGHLKTITEHKILVMQHCFKIGLYYQGLTHDLSKYLPSELLMGFMYYADGKESPNNKERYEKGYSYAWMHHKGRNKHHFEYWNDYDMHPKDITHPVTYVQMPRRYVAEMLMDRISASKNYNKEAYNDHQPLAYYDHGKGQYLMNEQTRKELRGMLRILDEKGEEELFRFVKDYYLKGYKI